MMSETSKCASKVAWGFRISSVERGVGFHGFPTRVDSQDTIQPGSIPNWLEGSVLMQSAQNLSCCVLKEADGTVALPCE